jgi:uncharacterized protein YkwD
MNGKLITTFLMLAITILSACGSQSLTESSVPAVTETLAIPVTGAAATETEVQVATDAPPDLPTLAPTFTSTPEPPRPTNTADCTNSASFVTDVTIPDNTEIVGGETFTKTWRILNNGTCIWASDYTLSHYSDERMNAPASVPLAITYPGQTVDISVPLTAPNTIKTHRGNFVIKNPAGLIMKIDSDSRLWLIIDVKTVTAATVAAIGATNTPAGTTSGGGIGFANVTCAYTVDQAKLVEARNAINAYRAQFGKPAYKVDAQLVLAAQAHANDMACNNLFVHTGSNGSTIASRVAASGYTAASVSENVYGSYPPLSGPDVVNWWKNDQTDPRHNLNLVSDTFTEIGVGYAFFNNFGYYVIVFASR